MQWFAIKKTFRLGAKSLWMHRLRSVLTTLGIVFGVCSVIAMLAIGEGASQEAQDAIAQLGSSNIIIESVKPSDTQADSDPGMNQYGLTYSDAEAIRNSFPAVEVAVPIRHVEQEARYHTRRQAITIIGTLPWYTETTPLNIIRGRFLTSYDLQYQMNVCVIDRTIAEDLFMFDEPIGNTITVGNSVYVVVGISGSDDLDVHEIIGDDSSSSSSSRQRANVYMPITTTRGRFTDISLTFSDGGISTEKVELQRIIVKLDTAEEVIPMSEILQNLLDRRHRGKRDFNIIVPLELLRQAARTRRIFSIVLGSIAAISLLVGGIGIMNIMLASVSERTREIGIRRALGAKKADIIVQFLSETLILTLTGGLIGIIMGSLIPVLVTYFAGMPTIITASSLILSFGISAMIGLTFGIYPAWRAANMDPIESLRHE